MKKPPTTFEELYKYLNNKNLRKLVEEIIELTIQYHNVWFSQNQHDMENELQSFKKNLNKYNNLFLTIKNVLLKNINQEYLKRVSSYDWKRWTIEGIKESYENQ